MTSWFSNLYGNTKDLERQNNFEKEEQSWNTYTTPSQDNLFKNGIRTTGYPYGRPLVYTIYKN